MTNEARLCQTCGSCTRRDSRKRCMPCSARAKRERWARDAGMRERHRDVRRAWARANPEKTKAADRRKNYGITDDEFRALHRAQEGRCAICRVHDATAVDHCHASGRIRALLCRGCNAGLGFFRDDPVLMRAAAAYLGIA